MNSVLFLSFRWAERVKSSNCSSQILTIRVCFLTLIMMVVASRSFRVCVYKQCGVGRYTRKRLYNTRPLVATSCESEVV